MAETAEAQAVKPSDNIIENWLDAEDKATDLLEHPTTDEGVSEAAIPEEKPEEKPEEPPAEPPPDEKPPAPVEEPEEQPPAQEAKPEEKSKPWAELRAAQREKKELEAKVRAQEAELARLRRPVEAPIEEEYQPPATKGELEELRAKTVEYDTQIAQIRQAEQARILIDAVQREETAFEKEHPDYREAVDYIKQVQLKEFELGGQLDAVASDLIQNRADEVENIASRYNVAPEQCARDLAFQILFETRKKDFAMRNVGNVAKRAYDLAQAYGFKSKAKEPPVKEEPKGPTPQEKVIRAVKNQAITQSLSAMTTGGGARNPQITTRAELMQLDPIERDAYIDAADARNPKWLEELE